MIKKISILIVDDEDSIRISLKSLFEKQNYKVGIAKNASIALKKLKTTYYNLILTDIMMEGKTGIELLKFIKINYPDIAVLLMTGYASMDTAMESVSLGAMDYLVKPISKETLLFNVERCLEINRTQKVIGQIKTSNDYSTTISKENELTQREKLVYNLLINGMPSKAIAEEIKVSLSTVKFHLKNIYKKFGIKGRSGILKIISQKSVK